MLRCTTIIALLGATLGMMVAGCYNPTPAPGAYRCAQSASGSDLCPTGQSCVCGLCVNHESEAACTFKLDTSLTASAPSVNEHQPFPVTITALTKSGGTATDFSGTVALSFVLSDGSPWCDVSPATVQLKNGVADKVMVTLNRETIPPQAPTLAASFYGNSGRSGAVTVVSPDFSRDVSPVIGPVSATSGFGWANASVAEPAVTFSNKQFQLYFAGTNQAGTKVGIGAATSADGQHFTALDTPLLLTGPGSFYSQAVGSPAVMFDTATSSYSLAFGGSNMAGFTPPASIGVATSTDALSGFTIANAGKPVLQPTPSAGGVASCDYCGNSADTPSFVYGAPADVAGDGGAAQPLLMFFSAISGSAAAIGLATSADHGATWQAAPSAVLNGDVGGEAILLSPHVLLDGSIYKMWYSFARLSDYLSLKNGMLCDLPVYIGYATSSDAYYWVRSPQNVSAPAVGLGSGSGSTWDTGYVTFIAGSAIPTNGTDASAGISLYYSALHHATLGDLSSKCVADSIGRATRP